MVFSVTEDIVCFTKAGIETHNDLFTDRVYRRVGHLCELLLEEVCKVTLLFGECRQRRIITHRTGGLFAFMYHRLDHFTDHFERIVEVTLFRFHITLAARHIADFDIGGMLLQIGHMLVEPLGIRMLGFEIVVDILIFHHFA